MNPITSWIQSGMEDPLARQRDHDLRVAKNTYYATELAAELREPVHSDKFVVLNGQKDEYQEEIKRTVVEARRRGRDPLGNALKQAQGDVLRIKAEKILAAEGGQS